MPIFTVFLDMIALIADTDLGATFIAIAAAMAILGRSVALGSLAAGGFTRALGGMAAALGLNRAALGANIAAYSAFGAMTRTQVAQQQAAAAALRRTALMTGGLLGGLALVSSGAAQSMGLQNTALFAMMGLMAGPWGAAVGAGAGLLLDFKASSDASSAASSEFSATLNQQTGALTANSREWVAKQLLEKGALEDARALGIELSTVTDAVLGEGDALGTLVAQL